MSTICLPPFWILRQALQRKHLTAVKRIVAYMPLYRTKLRTKRHTAAAKSICISQTMVDSSNETTVDRKLSDIFGEAYALYNSFDTCNEPTNSPEFQVGWLTPLFSGLNRIITQLYALQMRYRLCQSWVEGNLRDAFLLGKHQEMHSAIRRFHAIGQHLWTI